MKKEVNKTSKIKTQRSKTNSEKSSSNIGFEDDKKIKLDFISIKKELL